jgi:hypothetical protein
MDIATVEQQYNQLQQEAQGVSQGLQSLAAKLKTAVDAGNADAREWLLDLKELAINIQQEQQQVMMVMQSMHQAVQNDQQTQGGQWQPGYPQTPQAPGYGQQQPQSGGFLNSLEHSGFGQAIMMGAGFGIGDDLINSIF